MKNETVQPSATEQALAKIEFTDTKAFEAIVAAISGLADKYRGLKITDTKSYKVVVGGIAEMRGLRIAVENRRKEKKADILAAGRQIDSGAKKIAELLWPIETDLKATKQAVDDEKTLAKAAEDRLEKERIESIQAKIAAFPPDISRLPQLIRMPPTEIQILIDELAATEIDLEIYQEFTPEAIKVKTDKAKLLQEHYVAKILSDAEEKKRQAEALRVKQANEEQRAKQKIEEDRLAKIRETQEAEAQKLRDAQAEIDAQAKILQDKQDRLENERLERERIEEEKLAQAEADRVAQIEAEEQERLRVEQEAEEKATREKADAEEKIMQKALRPDKEALELYVSAIRKTYIAIEEPLLKTQDGNMILTKIQAHIEEMFNDTLDIIEDM